MDKSALFSFTPSLMEGETLEAIFVQREALATDLVERIRDSVLTQTKLHTLIIGARGMGKTHLVSLVHHRVQAMDDLKERLLIAWLREEEWGVTSFLDVMLRIFRALAEGDATVEERMEGLYELSSENAEAAGVRLLNELIGERTLLLIAENLDDLFGGLGEQGQQKLRAFLQTHANCTILATSPRLFNGVQRRTAPFYGFFRPVHLDELTTAEAQQLLVNIAKWRHQTDLVDFLNTPTGQTRVKAVQHLAGGNPRIYIIFADFLTYQSLEELVSPFMSLVDVLTPYYQSRMQYLSAQQRKIVELLCEKKYALPVKTIAQRCFMTAQTASSQLKELREKGYVKAEAIGRESFYDIAEPLMRICLGVKKERGEPLRLMIDFLRVWYPQNELHAMQQMLLINSEKSVFMYRYLERALDDVETIEEDPRVQAYLNEIQVHLNQEDCDSALKIAEKLLLIRDSWLERVQYAICLLKLERYNEALENINQVIEVNPRCFIAWILRGAALSLLDSHEEASVAFEKATTTNPENEFGWLSQGFNLVNLHRHEEAIVFFNKALEINPDDSLALSLKGLTFLLLRRYAQAIESIDKALKFRSDEVLKTYRTDALVALNSWPKNFKMLSVLFEEEKSIEVGFLEKAISSLLTTISDPRQWQPNIVQLINLWEKQPLLLTLGAALITTTRELTSELVSLAKATAWRDAWAEVVEHKPEFDLPLRLLNTALHYKQNPEDPRVFLELPIEERKILQQALGIEHKSN
jgi:tetratricopeptide (TPR) repeat protein